MVPLAGGLGDILLKYLLPGDCGYIADLRRGEPDAKVRGHVMSTNPHSAVFAAGLFDEMRVETWDGDYRAFLDRSGGRRIEQSRYRWVRPEIALTTQERKLADGLGSFVAVHPFAGTANRAWADRLDLERMVDVLCDAGLTVVMLGGSSVRTAGKGKVTVEHLNDVFTMERPGLVNLVNRYGVRLQAHLAARAQRFIGSFSCYHCAAFACDVPSLVLAPADFRGFFSAGHPVYGVMAARQQTRIHYFEDGGLMDRIFTFATMGN